MYDVGVVGIYITMRSCHVRMEGSIIYCVKDYEGHTKAYLTP